VTEQPVKSRIPAGPPAGERRLSIVLEEEHKALSAAQCIAMPSKSGNCGCGILGRYVAALPFLGEFGFRDVNHVTEIFSIPLASDTAPTLHPAPRH